MMQMRTHTCNELRLEHVGQQVKIVGWMENVRAVGQNFAFVVLRDFYGTTQVVVENEEMMNIINGLNKESTISVEGVVRERASKNPKQATGDIEVVPSKIEVLGRCRYNSLPFEINRSREADETARLKYRFLDLRNPAVKQNIILRCQVVAALRAAMTEHGFLEITTPILTASSPEGARDYLVPARKHPGIHAKKHIKKVDWNADCLEAQRVPFDLLPCGQPQCDASLLHLFVIQMRHADSALVDADSAHQDQQRPQPQSFQNRLQQHSLFLPLLSCHAEPAHFVFMDLNIAESSVFQKRF